MSHVGKLQKILLEQGKFAEDFEDTVMEGARFYENDLPNFGALRGELSFWKHL